MVQKIKTITLIGAGGKMGMRVSDNLQKSNYEVYYCETFPKAQEAMAKFGRKVSIPEEVIPKSDVVILAVPDIILGKVSEQYVPLMKSGAILLTLDPAVSYANLIKKRDDILFGVAHPCHPSIFLEKKTPEEYADTFGGIATKQEIVASFEKGSESQREELGKVIEVMYQPVSKIHWITVKQLTYLEPTLVETVAITLVALMKETLDEIVKTTGVPEEAAKAILFGHIQIALAVVFKATNPFSDACMIAMEYGKENLIKADWKKIFEEKELDKVVAKMLKIDAINR